MVSVVPLLLFPTYIFQTKTLSFKTHVLFCFVTIRLRALAGGEHNQNTPISPDSHYNHSPSKDSSANYSDPERKKTRYSYGRDELLNLFEKIKPRLKEYYTNHGLERDRYYPTPSSAPNSALESPWSRPLNSEALGRMNRLDKYFRSVKTEFENADRDRFEKAPLER